MKVFSLDCSTTTASVALFDDQQIVAMESWVEERARHEKLFDISGGLIKKANWQWSEIDLFAVGRGPGAYSGLRVSLLAAQAWAAPGNIPVIGISSMDAAAWAIMAEKGLEHIIIVGDARRNSFWYGDCFRETLISRSTDWKVAPNEQAMTILGGADVIATPHWDAIAPIRTVSAKVNWLVDPFIPTAVDVARLAWLRRSKEANPEPLTPLYLHPAV